VDLWDPSGAKVVEGRFPEDGKRPGLKKFVAPVSGDYTLVVRAVGPVVDPGIAYRLKVKVARSKDALRLRGATVAPAGLGTKLTFPGVEGMVLSGTLVGAFAKDPVLRGPDGTTVPCPLVEGPRHSRRFEGVVLAGGSGVFDLLLPVVLDVSWDLRLKSPKPVKVVEAEE
jgi:hypothetical protein